MGALCECGEGEHVEKNTERKRRISEKLETMVVANCASLELGIEPFLRFLDTCEQISRQPLWNAWLSAKLPESVAAEDVAEAIFKWVFTLYNGDGTGNPKNVGPLCAELYTRYSEALRVYATADGRLLSKDEFIEQFVEYSLYPTPALLDAAMGWPTLTRSQISGRVSTVVSHWVRKEETDTEGIDNTLAFRWKCISACKPQPSGPLVAVISDYYAPAVVVKYSGAIGLKALGGFVQSVLRGGALTKLWTTGFKLGDDSGVDVGSISKVVTFLGVFHNRMSAKKNPTIARKKRKEVEVMMRPVIDWIVRYKLPYKKVITREEFNGVMSAWLIECDDFVEL